MKKKISIFLMALMVSFGFFFTSSTAQANHCKWVPAHWSNGVHYKGKTVCWQRHYRNRCHWVNGYRHNGYWHKGHNVCN